MCITTDPWLNQTLRVQLNAVTGTPSALACDIEYLSKKPPVATRNCVHCIVSFFDACNSSNCCKDGCGCWTFCIVWCATNVHKLCALWSGCTTVCVDFLPLAVVVVVVTLWPTALGGIFCAFRWQVFHAFCSLFTDRRRFLLVDSSSDFCPSD